MFFFFYFLFSRHNHQWICRIVNQPDQERPSFFLVLKTSKPFSGTANMRVTKKHSMFLSSDVMNKIISKNKSIFYFVIDGSVTFIWLVSCSTYFLFLLFSFGWTPLSLCNRTSLKSWEIHFAWGTNWTQLCIIKKIRIFFSSSTSLH